MNWGRLSETLICGNLNTAKISNYIIVNVFCYQEVVGHCYGCVATAAAIGVVTL